jgi:hypothetical protein
MKPSAVVSHRVSSSAAAARDPASLPPKTRAAANDESSAAPQCAEERPGPVWVRAIAIAIFLGATARLL